VLAQLKAYHPVLEALIMLELFIVAFAFALAYFVTHQ
jgi:hypothetical protein